MMMKKWKVIIWINISSKLRGEDNLWLIFFQFIYSASKNFGDFPLRIIRPCVRTKCSKCTKCVECVLSVIANRKNWVWGILACWTSFLSQAYLTNQFLHNFQNIVKCCEVQLCPISIWGVSTFSGCPDERSLCQSATSGGTKSSFSNWEHSPFCPKKNSPLRC